MPEAPAATPVLSTTTTSSPALARCQAVERPWTPAPTTRCLTEAGREGGTGGSFEDCCLLRNGIAGRPTEPSGRRRPAPEPARIYAPIGGPTTIVSGYGWRGSGSNRRSKPPGGATSTYRAGRSLGLASGWGLPGGAEGSGAGPAGGRTAPGWDASPAR